MKKNWLWFKFDVRHSSQQHTNASIRNFIQRKAYFTVALVRTGAIRTKLITVASILIHCAFINI